MILLKKIFIVLLLVITKMAVFGQPFNNLITNLDYLNYVMYANILEDENIVYLRLQQPRFEDSTSLAQNNWERQYLTVVNPHTNDFVERIIPSKSDSVVYVEAMTVKNNNIYTISKVNSSYEEQSIEATYYIDRYDENLNKNFSYPLLGVDSIQNFERLIYTHDNYIIASGVQAKTASFTGYVSFLGKWFVNGALEATTGTSLPTNMYHLNDTVLISDAGGGSLRFYNYQTLAFNSNVPLSLLPALMNINYSSVSMVFDTAAQIGYSGGYTEDNPLEEMIIKYDINNDTEASFLYRDTLDSTFVIDVINSYNSMDIYGDNIFLSNSIYCTTEGCCLFDGNAIDCANYFSYHSVKTDGTLNCKKILGGDAAYVVTKLLATPDGGSLMFLMRHEVGHNLFRNNDLYYAKMDADCNLEYGYLDTAITTTIDNIETLDFWIFPNPSEGIYTFQGDFEEHYDIVVYDNLGKEVLKEQLVEVLDMSFAAEGTYLYTITDKQNVIRQAGQLIKH